MKKFILGFRQYKEIKKYGFYRFCFIPFDKKGNGMYSTIEFFDNEINKLDKNKIQIIQL